MHAPKSQASKPLLLFMLIVASSIGSLTMLVLIPGIPGIQSSFGVSYAAAQLALTTYLVALAAGQLVFGPLSDTIGRRPVMVASITIFALGGVIGALAPNLPVLLLARVLQGIGACGAMVLSRAIVADIYTGNKAASVLGYVIMAWSTIPMFGPLVGGVLTESFGWRAILWFTAIFGLALLPLVYFRLAETNFDRIAFKGGAELLKETAELVADRMFFTNTVHVGATAFAFYAFMAGSAIIASQMGGSGMVYGLYFLLVAGGYTVGNLITGMLASRIGSRPLIIMGASIVLAGASVTFAMFMSDAATFPGFFGMMTIFAFGCGLLVPTGISAATGARPRLAGTASALTGSLQMTLGGLATLVVGILQPDHMIATAAAMQIGASIVFVAALLTPRFFATTGGKPVSTEGDTSP